MKPEADNEKKVTAFNLDRESIETLRWLADEDTEGNLSQMLRRLLRQEKARRLEQMQAQA